VTVHLPAPFINALFHVQMLAVPIMVSTMALAPALQIRSQNLLLTFVLTFFATCSMGQFDTVKEKRVSDSSIGSMFILSAPNSTSNILAKFFMLFSSRLKISLTPLTRDRLVSHIWFVSSCSPRPAFSRIGMMTSTGGNECFARRALICSSLLFLRALTSYNSCYVTRKHFSSHKRRNMFSCVGLQYGLFNMVFGLKSAKNILPPSTWVFVVDGALCGVVGGVCCVPVCAVCWVCMLKLSQCARVCFGK